MRSRLLAILLTLFPAMAIAQPRTDCLPDELKGLLIEIEARFGKVTITSTLRENEKTSVLRIPSKHSQCNAVDFTMKDQSAQATAATWLMDKPFEVIVYSGRLNHIHVATGTYKAYRTIGPRATEHRSRMRMLASY